MVIPEYGIRHPSVNISSMRIRIYKSKEYVLICDSSLASIL